MLLETIPPIFFEKYHDSIRQHLPESQTGHGTDSFNAGELVEFIKTSVKQAEKILMYREFLVNSDNYMKPYMDKGEPVRGFYEMDSMFVSDMLKKGYFYTPRKLLLTVPLGVACNLDEIQKHQTTNMSSELYANSLDAQILKRQLKRKPFIIRVQKCNDFEIFRALRHVGLWGENIYKNSSIAREFELDKFKNRIRPASEYPGDFLGKKRKSLKPINKSYQHRYEYKQYKDQFNKYEEKHESFLFFEVILINDSII